MILPGNAGFFQFSKRSVDNIGPGQRSRTDKGSFTYIPAFVLEGQKPCFQADSCSSSAGDSFDTLK